MYTQEKLVRIAKRENNSKRNYLVINRLQGKHIPVSPSEAFAMFDALADKLREAYPGEALLLIGFAETATAIGARLAICLGSSYIQTTREHQPGASYLYFTEAHSHATEQKLAADGLGEVLSHIRRIIFVEDEITTGNTILSILHILKKNYPSKHFFSVASLLNGMDLAARERFAAEQIDLHFLVKTDHAGYEKIADESPGGGRMHLPDFGMRHPAEFLSIGDGINARCLTSGAAYGAACAILWEKIQERADIGSGQDILVLGTEEFMYPALFIGEQLERQGNAVSCHSTTRSPILPGEGENYFPRRRYELASFYEDGRRTFLYDIRSYDRVFVLTDAPAERAAAVHSLANALISCGNQNITWIRWCET